MVLKNHEKEEIINFIKQQKLVIVFIFLTGGLLALLLAGWVAFKFIKAKRKDEEFVLLPKNDIVISDIQKTRIQGLLNDFEVSEKYLDNKCSLGILAKKLKTNSVYLSKIINESKKMNFANYINLLRINYAKKRLENDQVFRTYTIEAIAKESGFNTAQSFSKAFQKITNKKPSEYIKKIKG